MTGTSTARHQPLRLVAGRLLFLGFSQATLSLLRLSGLRLLKQFGGNVDVTVQICIDKLLFSKKNQINSYFMRMIPAMALILSNYLRI